ncbi:MAG: TRAP transporter substrate-binding protein DctP [Chloroflexi bacterium]|nr:TRAP transporter substrate-binding protein DctP [Chloroflexota bacterium]
MLRSSLSAALLLLVAASACTPPRPAAPAGPRQTAARAQQHVVVAPLPLRFHQALAKPTAEHRAAERFAELAGQKSGGAIQVQVVADSDLSRAGQAFQALQAGAIHFIALGSDQLGDVAPEWEAAALPAIFASQAAVDRFVAPDSVVARALFERLRSRELLGLAVWVNGFKYFTNARHRLASPADFHDLAFGVTNGPEEAFVQALGGGARLMAPEAALDALRQGALDGQYSTWNHLLAQRLDQVQQYGTIARGGALLSSGVATSAPWWDGLEPGTRQLLGEAMAEATAYANQLARDGAARALEQVRASGRLELHWQTREEAQVWAEAAAQVHQQWARRGGHELIDQLKALN